ncbi:uncharacterized protein LOC130817879 isoform X2 [Amaranthus tricolor]|uniref:uncharacterized protein LOC130817879 isoform X2 n=1 Tax=Amaranthus tricolor TaxID=29722 RepID=UPI002586F4FD|nr:uncharacterized protein LOC130817879 isoform X2 [Amaranthus tricolor]
MRPNFRLLLIAIGSKSCCFEKLEKIRSNVLRACTKDECTTNQRRVSYARVLIEVDVSKPLPKVIPVEDKEDHVDDQAFFIKWVPYFCQKCRALGHICDE